MSEVRERRAHAELMRHLHDVAGANAYQRTVSVAKAWAGLPLSRVGVTPTMMPKQALIIFWYQFGELLKSGERNHHTYLKVVSSVAHEVWLVLPESLKETLRDEFGLSKPTEPEYRTIGDFYTGPPSFPDIEEEEEF